MGSPAPSVRKALQDATTRWPNRSKLSDGIMGDASHQKRKSDHNEGNAFDITHDPVNGPDCNEWAQIVIDDPRVKYVIWNRRIYIVSEGMWKEYSGSSPHDKHMHVSIYEKSRNDLSPWPWLTHDNYQRSTEDKGNICYPIRRESGQEFNHIDEILAHLEGESTGLYMIGRNGMWHGGIHITDATTPWCALSGKGAGETVQHDGREAIRCMVDGEVVAYRLCKDYIPVSWITGPLSISGSFVLVRHYIQPGKTEKSGLHFYTLYMHLAPYSAYPQDSHLMKVADGQHLNAYIDASLLWCVRSLPGGTRVSWDKTDAAASQKGKNGRQYARVTLADGLEGTPALSAGDKVWVVCDRGNLVPENDGPVRPAWWVPLISSEKDKIQFDRVVSVSEPFAISAGAPVGHMGFVQAPKEVGTESRYQVHIECLSTDDNLENFLTNPEAAGKDNPLYIRCTPGLALYQKDVEAGFVKTGSKTKEDNILLLSKVPVETGGTQENPEQYYYFPEGFVLKDEKLPECLSQYDLEKLGFTLMKDEPENFVHLDGKNQPKGLVRQLYETLRDASKKDLRVSHALETHNYQRLLDNIDSNRDGFYSPEEYRRAVHNPSYRDALYKVIVRHPSDWYYKSDEGMWAGFIKKLEKYAPDWVPYTQQFTDKLCWMQELTKLNLGPVLWHMHPVMFLGALKKRKKLGWAHSKFADLLGRVESKNDYTAYNVHVTYTPHYNTNLTKMTIKDVMNSQADPTINGLFATGRFQITPDTLHEAVRYLSLDLNELYDEVMQDRIFEEYLIKVKRPAIIMFLEESGSVEDAIYEWALEFASAGVRKGREISPSKNEFEHNADGSVMYSKKGKPIHKRRYASIEGMSYYSGDGVNKAHIMPDDMVKALQESKNENY
ncbi:hypothetical protein SMC92_000996 [Cronobacter dublinensis]|nr:hypothetical protein [Cronobacter dublinensis]